jgi:hypothetical protein
MGKKFALFQRQESEMEQGMCLSGGKNAAQLQAEGTSPSLYLGSRDIVLALVNPSFILQ